MGDYEDALRVLWETPDLSYLLHSSQEELRAEYEASSARPFVVACSRRWGKTFWCCVLATECALRGGRVIYAYPKQKQAKRVVRTEMRKVLKDCPEALRPTFMKSDLQWLFPSGGQIDLAGCDNGNAESLRGEGCQLAVLDEAGFIDELDYVYRDIVKPQLLTTGGDVIMPSTPSKSPAHPFVSKFMFEAEESGQLVKRTIFDAPHIPHERKLEFIEEDGGMESTTVKREYLVEPVVDANRAIVPEFSRDLVMELDPEPSMDRYVVADFGWSDLTAIGFWEWHFQRAKAYLRAELIFRNASSADIAPAVKEMEAELWGEAKAYARFGDPNAHKSYGAQSRITLADFAIEHDLEWTPCRRDNLEGGVNALRLHTREGRYAIHPSCTTTIAHLAGGIWNKNRTSFERSGEEFGHFDAVAMSMYACRHIDRTHNPYPRFGADVQPNTHHRPPERERGNATSRTIGDAIRGIR